MADKPNFIAGVIAEGVEYESMQEFNKITAVSSQTRYNRIAGLLNSHASQPYDFDRFVSFSNDQNAGPDNSIFRTGSTPQKSRTMAVWAVAIAPAGSPVLYAKIMNPGKEETVLRISIDDVFSGEATLADE
jgi:hypothetical protein